MLPPETDVNVAVIGNGIALDWSARLRHARAVPTRLVVIPLSTAIRYHVKDPHAAAGVLGATHTLQVRARGGEEGYAIGATLFDIGRGRSTGLFESVYRRNTLGASQRLSAERLSRTLGFPVETAGTALAAEAYSDYTEGLYYLEQAPNPERAIPYLRRALAADRDGSIVMLALAQAELLRFRHAADAAAEEQACQWLERASATAPKSGYVDFVRATLLRSAGRLSEAEKAFRHVLEADPRNGPALRGLASLLAESNRSDEAISVYRRAIQAEPGYFQPVLELGVLFYFRGQYAEAEREFVRVTELAGQLAQARQNLAAVLADTAQYDRAEKELQQALNLQRTSDTLAGMGAAGIPGPALGIGLLLRAGRGAGTGTVPANLQPSGRLPPNGAPAGVGANVYQGPYRRPPRPCAQ